MTPDQAIDVVRHSLMVALLISAPILAIGLIVGLAVSIFQAVTQIQEQTLSFVPKIFAMGILTMLIVPWIYAKMSEYAVLMFAP